MNTFTINEKIYSAKPFSTGTICDLEEMGIDFEKSAKQPFNLIRGYFMVCSGLDKDSASAEIDQHIANGGSIDTMINIMSKEMEESDFFRSFNQTTEKKTTPVQAKKK